VKEENKILKPFLPTTRELNEMTNIEFSGWIDLALTEIQKRREMRDPLFHLKKRISSIVNDESKSEIEKENAVEACIKKYYKLFTSQSE
jgi:hypothetical protein